MDEQNIRLEQEASTAPAEESGCGGGCCGGGQESPSGCGGCGCGGGGCCGGDAPQQPEEDQPSAPQRVTVVDIHFRSGGKVYFFDPGQLTIKMGDHVIIDTARGPEYGICAYGNHNVSSSDIVAPLRQVLRIATDHDEKIAAENREKEKRAMEVCQQKILDHKLEMQLVSAECAFDGSKILFFFTADGRVDFRELVKNLASVFRTRIELRQIGVRDKAKMVGGLGVCGRPFCCSQFLDDFQPVSIKMAKTQNLSLNPTKISGTCGRLMCCLKYEQEAYEDLLKTAPKHDSFVDTPDGRGTVCDVNLLRQSVRVRMETSPETIGTYGNDEIYVLRNGKAKKTDLPIPRDLAPISSQPRQPRKPLASGNSPTLDAVVFKNEPVMEQPTREAPPVDQSDSRNRNRRRRRGGGKPDGAPVDGTTNHPRGKQPQQERQERPERQDRQDRPKQPQQERVQQERPKQERPKQERPKQERPKQQQQPRQPQQERPQGETPAEGGESKPKNPNNRRRYRGRRPKNPGQGGQGGQGGQPTQGS